jgi:glycosyltransferase involved in cell wall biosynthesis
MKNIILFTHIDPIIHGQAMMANVFLQQSLTWGDVKIHPINAVYEEDRAKLRFFSWTKISRFWQYSLELQELIYNSNSRLMITTFAFFPGPFLKDCLLVIAARWLLGCRVIAWVHMDPNRLELENRPFWIKLIARLCVRSIEGWVACAPTLSRTWPKWMSAKPITEIANGIADPAPSPEQQSTPGQQQGLQVVFISAMDQEKGWRELFDAAEALCAEYGYVRFRFRGKIGGCENECDVREKFASSPFPDRITYEGPVSGQQKIELLRSSDVFCLPSWTEAFPLAVLDAMAFGLPCVVTDVGALRQAVTEGQEGFYAEPRNAQSLTEALRRAISDRSALARMGCAARHRFATCFTDEKFSKQWETYLINQHL